MFLLVFFTLCLLLVSEVTLFCLSGSVLVVVQAAFVYTMCIC